MRTETLSWDEAVEWLVEDDIATIREAMLNDDYSYLADILQHGKAYNEWELQDLINEIIEREGI